MSLPVSSLGDARAIALALPDAVEADHWGHPSFRVRGRIFATAPDPRHLNVMIDPFEVDAAVREQPDSCEQLLWGRQVRGVRVTLDAASPELLGDLLAAAWRRRAATRRTDQQPARTGGAGATNTLNLPPVGVATIRRLPSGLSLVEPSAPPETFTDPFTSGGT